jgi:hypothetical protein
MTTMTDADEAMSMFKADSADEKVEAFDESTTTLFLQQLGIVPQRVKQLRYDNGEAFCLSWAAGELGLEIDIWASRFFNYDLGQLLLAPQKSPVIKAYQEHVEEYDTDSPRFMIFKAYDVGRLVAMSGLPEQRPYICAVPGDNPVYITTFKTLFSDMFGSEHDL